MHGLGQRLKDRARALGWSDAEVARRLGLAQTRYANYVTDRHEPDLETLLRICRVLGTEPGELLGHDPVRGDAGAASGAGTGTGGPGGGEAAGQRLRRRIAAASQAMDEATLRLAAEVMDALAARPSARPLAPPEAPSGSRSDPSSPVAAPERDTARDKGPGRDATPTVAGPLRAGRRGPR